MTWTTPTAPTAGTVITVAWAQAQIVDLLNHLRAMTGTADPGASNRVVVSTGASTTTWQQIPTDALGDQVVTNAKIVNGTIIGDSKIAVSSITGNSGASAIGTGVIHANRIQGSTFDATQVAAAFVVGSIHANRIQGDTFDATQVAAAFATDSISVANAADILADNAIVTAHIADDAVTPDKGGVPLGAVVFFETLAELTAAGANWQRYLAADGRLLVGAGTTFGQTFTEATSYGSNWTPSSGLGISNTLGASAGGGSASSTALFNGGGIGFATDGHNHVISLSGSVTVTGTSIVWFGPMRAGIWGRRI